MTDRELVTLRRRLRADLVGDLVTSGFGELEAATMADVQLAAAFPSGRVAPRHRVCCVLHDTRVVGHVWFGPAPGTTDGPWWVYDLEVEEAHRGRGIATRVVALVEAEVSRRGGTTVGLNVFDHNTAARRLYDRLGYRAVSTSMRKVL